MESPSACPPSNISLGSLHSNLLHEIISFLDFSSALVLSLCCQRIRAAVFDPIRWPRLSLGARASDNSIILIRKLYGAKRNALRELQLKNCPVTSAFIGEILVFLGEENALENLLIKGCTRIGTLDLNFPRATHITIIEADNDFTFGTIQCPKLQCLSIPRPISTHYLSDGSRNLSYPMLEPILGVVQSRVLPVTLVAAKQWATWRTLEKKFIYLKHWETTPMEKLQEKLRKKFDVPLREQRLLYAGVMRTTTAKTAAWLAAPAVYTLLLIHIPYHPRCR